MKLCSAAKICFAIALGLLTVSAAAPALAKKPPPPTLFNPPPMPPQMPAIGLAAHFIDDAAIYAT